MAKLATGAIVMMPTKHDARTVQVGGQPDQVALVALRRLRIPAQKDRRACRLGSPRVQTSRPVVSNEPSNWIPPSCGYEFKHGCFSDMLRQLMEKPRSASGDRKLSARLVRKVQECFCGLPGPCQRRSRHVGDDRVRAALVDGVHIGVCSTDPVSL
ncbi:hypothetical protein FA95DRAFT_292901 [Auriscalpium vulgare]|uniref:Uncharacterized protein n=1 Tax=Auriscalpium vulgare TaxID=40419 RepID=A0ACB8RJN8_9AGAM|nr:hypothetical protein FA95DRAFT_292901 [Auriscalpium vulgare]